MNRTGYKTNFIKNIPVELPTFRQGMSEDVVTADAKKTGEIKYPHYSVFLSKSRRFPYFTATNIDGTKFRKIKRTEVFDSGRDEWSIDDRVTDFQWGQHLYNAKKSDFQRGHMTKREDPQWGDTVGEAREAAQQTFFFSNCVPQVGDLNTKEWGKLETYILSKESVPNELRVCVMTGPVLADTDPFFVTEVDDEEVQLPTLFWKIVYYTNDGETLSRAGFLMGQENLLLERKIAVKKQVDFMAMEVVPGFFEDFEDKDIYQVNVSTIEKLTKLRFAEADEAFTDSRPLKLIIDKVQVSEEMLMDVTAALNVDEDSNELVSFRNIVLKAPKVSKDLFAADMTPQATEVTVASLARSGPAYQYTGEMKKKFGYYATWNPGMPLALGDVGVVKDNIFRKITDLSRFGIRVEQTDDITRTDLKYSSKGSVTVLTKLSGNASIPGSSLSQADAGVVVEFSKENSVFFQANGTLTKMIADSVSIGNTVLDLFRSGKWDKNWVVITDLVTAESATILISNAAGAKIELKVNANVDAPSIDIANGELKFSTQFSRSMETEIVAKEGLTPLFRLMGIKTRLFSPPEFRAQGITGFDMLTPEMATNGDQKDKVTFGYLSDQENE
jgi:endonuclease G